MDAKEKTMLAKNGYTLTHVGSEYRIYQDGVKEPLHVIGDEGSGVAVHTFLAYANGENTPAPADDSEQEICYGCNGEGVGKATASGLMECSRCQNVWVRRNPAPTDGDGE